MSYPIEAHWFTTLPTGEVLHHRRRFRTIAEHNAWLATRGAK